MTNRPMITTPALNAMSGHGLTDAHTILAADSELYPKRQGQSVTRRAVAYSVYCPATERFSLVTLDGRWVIPGREGYKTRGPVSTYARKNIADVCPDGLVILEPVRHNGRYAVTRYGQRKAGVCRRQIHSATRGGYGYECSCGAVINPSDVARDGFTIVSDGRSGTHAVAYAVKPEHGIRWSADVAMRHDAPVVVATPFRPAAEVSAEEQERKAVGGARKAESAPVTDAPGESAADAPAAADAPFVGPYSVRERKIPGGMWGVGARPSRWDVVDGNGRVASADHMSALAASVRMDILNGEHGRGQTPETAPEGTPDNARRLVASGAAGRAYVTGNGARMRIESADGRCALTLSTVPDEAPDEAKAGFAAKARQFADGIRNRAESPAVFKPAKVQMWSGKPAPRRAFEPKDYAPGSMLAWTVDGVRYTGQVWATRVQGGDWNRNHSSYNPGEATAVIVATVDGRRARRDEAVAVPLYTGSRRKTAYAHVVFPMGPMDSDGRVPRWQADVTVIAPECASDGLFEVATPIDEVDVWEGEAADAAPVATQGAADVERARKAAEEWPEAMEARSLGDRYEGEFRRSDLLSELSVCGERFPFRFHFESGGGHTVTLPTGDVRGTWGEVTVAAIAYVIAERPAAVLRAAAETARVYGIHAERAAEKAEENARTAVSVGMARAALDTVREFAQRIDWDGLTDEQYDSARGAVREAEQCAERAESAYARGDVDTARWAARDALAVARWFGLDAPSAQECAERAPEACAVAGPVRPQPSTFLLRITRPGWEGPAETAEFPAGSGMTSNVSVEEIKGGAVAEAASRPANPGEFDADTSSATPIPGGEGGISSELDEVTSRKRREVRQAWRRAEEAEERAEAARRRAGALQGAADVHYGRFAGGQPILMNHHSARGALRDRARGDAATRRAIEAGAEADRAESAARKARAAAELAEIVHGRSRPWERGDFQRGDVVEARKIYTATYVVVRANAKTVTLRNVHTITDTKARYDQILSRTRDGQTVTNPGEADASPANHPEHSGELDENASTGDSLSGGKGGFSQELDADASKETVAPLGDVISDPGAVDAWESEGGAVPGVATPAAPPADELTATASEDEDQEDDEDAAAHAAAAGHPAFVECVTVAERTDPRTGRPKGGNAFSADKPSPCITATAYGWKDEESGERLDQATIGRLVGFPSAYPWRHVGRGAGIRNNAQQAADAVCPMVAAAVIGRALDVDEWETRARAYADALYRPGARPAPPLALPRPRPAVEAVGPVAVEATAPAEGRTWCMAVPAGRAAAVAAVGGLAGAPVSGPLSRRAQGWGCGGVFPGHSARQDATRQGARQATRQGSGPECGGRGPPRRPGRAPAGSATRRYRNLTGAHQKRDTPRRIEPPSPPRPGAHGRVSTDRTRPPSTPAYGTVPT
ncbi:DUF3560 domain-containing protein [Streptomyces sp. NPDC127106]|uniref:DUF3560 domain-containing protein n=1 Tax=Streptomyces sp. NPDC127106 TaxID=3345360 RepID=UPI00362A77FA